MLDKRWICGHPDSGPVIREVEVEVTSLYLRILNPNDLKGTNLENYSVFAMDDRRFFKTPEGALLCLKEAASERLRNAENNLTCGAARYEDVLQYIEDFNDE